MARRISLNDLRETDLSAAAAIAAVDPQVPGYYKQVWTLRPVDAVVRDGEAEPPPAAPDLLEVELDSADPDQLPRLKELVETAKATSLEGMWDLDS